MADNTVTIVSPTRWDGKHRTHGTVLRVPEDVDLKTARRWITKKIAVIGGEWTPEEQDAPADEPFKELEDDLNDETEQEVEALMQRTKADLLDIAKGRLIEVPSSATKEDVARLLVTTPED